MAASYDIQTYLLDRTNIHDTVTRFTFNCDRKSRNGLVQDVYAPQIALDYTSMFGSQPFETTKEEWAKTITSAAATYDKSTFDYPRGLIIELPQPFNNTPRPDKCRVFANVTAHMVRQVVKGGPIMHVGVSLLPLVQYPQYFKLGSTDGSTYNQSRLNFDVIRIPQLEQKGENPWRISKQVVDISWEQGNMDVIVNQVANIGN
ncbi:hypothetical protein F4813DRAFT_401047 [Daldinia decipiens]|uniref:uncharacterized protein n=1 Tax=Daldinia decipiens TaxID=326647 RepID=UPI0020C3F066|nr:uncharacterized protein F4813DRAFT_401047 [Daldinia decipiens]KAI1660052.1 hypothetical protein F4813DRAFT_401047 [Daldinia decipiens]